MDLCWRLNERRRLNERQQRQEIKFVSNIFFFRRCNIS